MVVPDKSRDISLYNALAQVERSLAQGQKQAELPGE